MDKITQSYLNIINQDIDSIVKGLKVKKIIKSVAPDFFSNAEYENGFLKISLHRENRFHPTHILATCKNGEVNIDVKDTNQLNTIIQALKQNGFKDFIINLW